jgi:hypothetical protein
MDEIQKDKIKAVLWEAKDKRTSVRHLQSKKETMDKYFAEIQRYVDSARICCKDGFGVGMVCRGEIPGCPFKSDEQISWCNVRMLASFLAMGDSGEV